MFKTGLALVLTSALLFSCSTTTTFDNSLADKNMSVVVSTELAESFYYASELFSFPYEGPYIYFPRPYENATLLKVNGKKITQQSIRHYISEGKNTLLVYCYIDQVVYFGSSSAIFNEFEFNVDLLKGHTYEIYPIVKADFKTREESCAVKLKDITEI